MPEEGLPNAEKRIKVISYDQREEGQREKRMPSPHHQHEELTMNRMQPAQVVLEDGRVLRCMDGMRARRYLSVFNPGGPETLVHLRLILSASELALLPFELAKVPVRPHESAES
jgi:hypothetical protein